MSLANQLATRAGAASKKYIYRYLRIAGSNEEDFGLHTKLLIEFSTYDRAASQWLIVLQQPPFIQVLQSRYAP